MRFTFSTLALVLGATASTVDPKTGITFEKNSTSTGYSFGIALPLVPSKDFIGQIIYPTTGTGYGGLSLTGKMANSLLVVAWPNAGKVVSSFRFATGHIPPTPYAPAYAAGSTFALTPIPNGTYVNSTHLSYTFVCKGCITGDSLSFSKSAASTNFGFSLCGNAVTNPASGTAATFKFHNLGQGSFSISLNKAKSASYDKWAAMANHSAKSTTRRDRIVHF